MMTMIDGSVVSHHIIQQQHGLDMTNKNMLMLVETLQVKFGELL